ncbi:hypothetical protein [Halorussus sp. MSC15.2]|uniref:hypothetical protein n=1 Tax=Halorussus sp. MSC15.2 TaxID=2283638 RepID=UPI0013CFA7AF|nr:hypothetical protein [Halorussus sp. MSC15.2]NEU58735.1 hypothetical protein [Halorussus sp. MSC15.2]
MDGKDTSSLLDLNRRNFTKGLLSIGLSASAAAGLSKEALAELTDNPNEEVPRLGWYEIQNYEEIEKNGVPPEIKPKYYTISRDKWVKTTATEKASEQLAKRYTDSNISVGLVPHESKGIAVGVNYIVEESSDGKTKTPNVSFTEVQKQTPANVSATVSTADTEFTQTDIPITVKRTKKQKEQTKCGEVTVECHYEHKYDPIPAGCEAGTSATSGCSWSLGPVAYSNKYNEYVILTAGHCVDSTGQSVYQPSRSNDYFGSVAEFGPDGMDSAVIEPYKRDVTMGIVDSGGGTRYPIKGMVSKTRINDMMEAGTGVYHTGRSTGDGYGQIDFHADNDDYPWMGYAISTAGGDSGSVTYDIVNDTDAYVVALHTGGYCSDGMKYGSGECMYSVEQEMNINYSSTL